MEIFPTTNSRGTEEISAHPERAANFDRLARIYRWMEYLSFGPMLERCRFHFLTECRHASQALVLGDGDGRFTARVLGSNPSIKIDAVDGSAAMLAQLRRRSNRANADAPYRLRTIHADIRTFALDRDEYDLIVSHFFLDCLTGEEIARLTERLLPHLATHAHWLISEFSIPRTGWRRGVARLIVGFLYFAFHKMTGLSTRQLPDYDRILPQFGFHRRSKMNFLCNLLSAELWIRE